MLIDRRDLVFELLLGALVFICQLLFALLQIGYLRALALSRLFQIADLLFQARLRLLVGFGQLIHVLHGLLQSSLEIIDFHGQSLFASSCIFDLAADFSELNRQILDGLRLIVGLFLSGFELLRYLA